MYIEFPWDQNLQLYGFLLTVVSRVLWNSACTALSLQLKFNHLIYMQVLHTEMCETHANDVFSYIYVVDTCELVTIKFDLLQRDDHADCKIVLRVRNLPCTA